MSIKEVAGSNPSKLGTGPLKLGTGTDPPYRAIDRQRCQVTSPANGNPELTQRVKKPLSKFESWGQLVEKRPPQRANGAVEYRVRNTGDND